MAKKVDATKISQGDQVIKACSCVSEYQDKRYGQGKRLMTIGRGLNGKFTCTVCGAKK
jgi:hypothetical protein